PRQGPARSLFASERYVDQAKWQARTQRAPALIFLHVAETALRRDHISHAALQLRGIRKTAVALALPDDLTVANDLEDAARTRPEAHLLQFLGKGKQKLLRHPASAQQPLALGAVGYRYAVGHSGPSGCAELRHGRVVDLEVGIDVLHVVIVLQHSDELEHGLSLFLVHRRARLRPPDGLAGPRLAKPRLQRGGDLANVLEGAGDHVPVLVRLHVFSARLDGSLHHLLGVGDIGRIEDFANAVEHEGDRTRLAQRSTGLGEGGAHIGGSSVAVVGEGLDYDSHAARPIAFIAHFLIVLRLGAGSLFDGPFDILLGHRLGLGV